MIRALRYLLASGSLTFASAVVAAPVELFFSEYVEGSSNNKALEIYNGTGAAVDLAAGGYSVQMFFNGSAMAGLTVDLTGTVANNDVFVLSRFDASAAILAHADQVNTSGWYNGDDAIVLRKGTTVIDSIGQVGFDPGTEWGSGLTSTADNTLRRLATIQAGDVDASDAFDPAAQWTGFATDIFGGLGAHDIVRQSVPEPGSPILLLLGLAGAYFAQRRRRSASPARLRPISARLEGSGTG